MTTRRALFTALLGTLVTPLVEAKGSKGSGSRRSKSGSSGRGGNSGGCGSRGGAGYRKANGKCAGKNE
jgi:uncharacterized membrane protein YgcG